MDYGIRLRGTDMSWSDDGPLKYIFEGRAVTIYDDSSMDRALRKNLLGAVLAFCEHDDLAKRVPTMIYHLQTSIPEFEDEAPTFANVDMQELANGRRCIYLNPWAFEHEFGTSARIGMRLFSSERDRFRQWVQGLIAHELTHILHYEQGAMAKFHQRINRWSAALPVVPGLTQDIPFKPGSYQENSIMHVRVTLAMIIGVAMSEGLAMHQEWLRKGGEFSTHEQEQLRRKAAYWAEANRDSVVRLSRCRDGNELFLVARAANANLAHSTYFIGQHVIFELLLAGVGWEELIRMQPLGIYAKYERTQRHPIISLTSGRGLMDYAALLKELRALHESKQPA